MLTLLKNNFWIFQSLDWGMVNIIICLDLSACLQSKEVGVRVAHVMGKGWPFNEWWKTSEGHAQTSLREVWGNHHTFAAYSNLLLTFALPLQFSLTSGYTSKVKYTTSQCSNFLSRYQMTLWTGYHGLYPSVSALLKRFLTFLSSQSPRSCLP